MSGALASYASIGRTVVDDTEAGVPGYSLRMFQGGKEGRKELEAAVNILQVRTFKFSLDQVLGHFVCTFTLTQILRTVHECRVIQGGVPGRPE